MRLSLHRAVAAALLLAAGPLTAKPPEMVEVEVLFVKVSEKQAKELVALEGMHFGSPAGGTEPAVGFTVSGVIDSASTQRVIRKLRELGAEFTTSPKTTVLSGRRARVQNVREFRYPFEYSKPSEVNGKVYPQNFATTNVGITLEFEPNVSGDTIDLILSPNITELTGFVDYSKEVAGAKPSPKPGQLEAELEKIIGKGDLVWQPVFQTRQVSTEVTMVSGQTIVITEGKSTPSDPAAKTTLIFATARQQQTP